MMNRDVSKQDIVSFLCEFWNARLAEIDESDALSSLGIVGDDADELVCKFAERYDIEMSRYRWYFHHDKEGWNFRGALFFRPPGRRVNRIPLTVDTLLQAARAGVWPISYPEHTLSRRRWDLIINLMFILVPLLLVAALWIRARLEI